MRYPLLFISACIFCLHSPTAFADNSFLDSLDGKVTGSLYQEEEAKQQKEVKEFATEQEKAKKAAETVKETQEPSSTIETVEVIETVSFVGDPATGASLYNDCVPCHGLNANAFAGWPVGEFMAFMNTFNAAPQPSTKELAQMYKVSSRLSETELEDIASYIAGM